MMFELDAERLVDRPDTRIPFLIALAVYVGLRFVLASDVAENREPESEQVLLVTGDGKALLTTEDGRGLLVGLRPVGCTACPVTPTAGPKAKG